jgi:D-serine deaminase-like pyridoxal phosphate-dependent protein
MRICDLDTPSILCDLDVLDRNLTSMAATCKDIGIPLRSHTKSHKIPEIAHRQMALGATGIACQKLGDAEVMVAAGLKEIMIPFNLVGAIKIERLLRLIRRATITVAVDSEDTARGISEGAHTAGMKVRTIIELDTGSKRCGVQSPTAARDLARIVSALPGIDFQGIMTYPSNLAAKPFLDETVELIKADGIPVNMVSGGGTGHELVSKQIGCTEVRSGSYVWEGLTRVHKSDDLGPDRCPIRIVCTVVSSPIQGRVIIDGGMKTFCSYPPTPYGHCIEYPELKIRGMSIEHGNVDSSRSSHTFKVGERLTWIPLHQEMCLNLHDEVTGVRGDHVELVWPVAGRGRVK